MGEIDQRRVFGEASLRRTMREFSAHYHGERNCQDENNVLLFPCTPAHGSRVNASVACRERLGGLLKQYQREACKSFLTRRHNGTLVGVLTWWLGRRVRQENDR